jgi:hypothetical protein
VSAEARQHRLRVDVHFANARNLDENADACVYRGAPRKQTPGGRHQIGIPAGFKSESVAGFLLECVAGFVGNCRPLFSMTRKPRQSICFR